MATTIKKPRLQLKKDEPISTCWTSDGIYSSLNDLCSFEKEYLKQTFELVEVNTTSNSKQTKNAATAREGSSRSGKSVREKTILQGIREGLMAPLSLIQCSDYSSQVRQPFDVKIYPEVRFICNLHGHLARCEIIGLLAGKWHADDRQMEVISAFPCKSLPISAEDSAVNVEMDPESMHAVREVISKRGLVVVGWYHSHPTFEPTPSVRDVENQCTFQSLFRDEVLNVQPFVGIIVSTFDNEASNSRAVLAAKVARSNLSKNKNTNDNKDDSSSYLSTIKELNGKRANKVQNEALIAATRPEFCYFNTHIVDIKEPIGLPKKIVPILLKHEPQQETVESSTTFEFTNISLVGEPKDSSTSTSTVCDSPSMKQGNADEKESTVKHAVHESEEGITEQKSKSSLETAVHKENIPTILPKSTSNKKDNLSEQETISTIHNNSVAMADEVVEQQNEERIRNTKPTKQPTKATKEEEKQTIDSININIATNGQSAKLDTSDVNDNVSNLAPAKKIQSSVIKGNCNLEKSEHVMLWNELNQQNLPTKLLCLTNVEAIESASNDPHVDVLRQWVSNNEQNLTRLKLLCKVSQYYGEVSEECMYNHTILNECQTLIKQILELCTQSANKRKTVSVVAENNDSPLKKIKCETKVEENTDQIENDVKTESLNAMDIDENVNSDRNETDVDQETSGQEQHRFSQRDNTCIKDMDKKFNSQDVNVNKSNKKGIDENKKSSNLNDENNKSNKKGIDENKKSNKIGTDENKDSIKKDVDHERKTKNNKTGSSTITTSSKKRQRSSINKIGSETKIVKKTETSTDESEDVKDSHNANNLQGVLPVAKSDMTIMEITETEMKLKSLLVDVEKLLKKAAHSLPEIMQACTSCLSKVPTKYRQMKECRTLVNLLNGFEDLKGFAARYRIGMLAKYSPSVGPVIIQVLDLMDYYSTFALNTQIDKPWQIEVKLSGRNVLNTEFPLVEKIKCSMEVLAKDLAGVHNPENLCQDLMYYMKFVWR